MKRISTLVLALLMGSTAGAWLGATGIAEARVGDGLDTAAATAPALPPQQEDEDWFDWGEEETFGDEGVHGEDETYAQDDEWFGEDETFAEDDYGSYDQNYDWDTDDEWFNDWYGESDEWF